MHIWLRCIGTDVTFQADGNTGGETPRISPEHNLCACIYKSRAIFEEFTLKVEDSSEEYMLKSKIKYRYIKN